MKGEWETPALASRLLMQAPGGDGDTRRWRKPREDEEYWGNRALSWSCAVEMLRAVSALSSQNRPSVRT